MPPDTLFVTLRCGFLCYHVLLRHHSTGVCVRARVLTDGAVTEVGSDQTPSEVRVFCNVRGNGSAAATTDRNNSAALDDVHFRSTYCKLTLPHDGQTLSLAYGRGTDRYAYHGTADNDCGVSFPKPIRRSEIGRWKCANAMSDNRIYGGFVVVASSNDTQGALAN